MRTPWRVTNHYSRGVSAELTWRHDETAHVGTAHSAVQPTGVERRTNFKMWKSPEKILQKTMLMTSREGVSFRENLRFQGIPPSPLPSESRDRRGVCKKCLQNLEPQGFRGQNLDNKGVAAFFEVAACTAS